MVGLHRIVTSGRLGILFIFLSQYGWFEDLLTWFKYFHFRGLGSFLLLQEEEVMLYEHRVILDHEEPPPPLF